MRHSTFATLCTAGMCLIGLGTAALGRGAALNAPAGIAPATAPGGTKGRAGQQNTADAVRSGQALFVPAPGSEAEREQPTRSRSRPKAIRGSGRDRN